ncbi:MAG: cupin domain-containing protein [Ardenticatenaceae bacterium]|nr:cupin domain-containing protein [Ardenticatenaceae bacterium]MCB8986258.1 cupin domain-containing protein [Ardenticatenaceae bacterium]
MTRDNIIHVEKWPYTHTPTEAELHKLMEDEGLQPYRWSNNPGDYYDAHVHDYHKVVYVVSGSITFGFPIDGEPTTLRPGDRLDLPAGVRHNAAVGSEGVVCLEARR